MSDKNENENENKWEKVIFASDCIACECCDEPVCPVCSVHYADCLCPGPTMDEYDYKEIDGVMYARLADEDE